MGTRRARQTATPHIPRPLIPSGHNYNHTLRITTTKALPPHILHSPPSRGAVGHSFTVDNIHHSSKTSTPSTSYASGAEALWLFLIFLDCTLCMRAPKSRVTPKIDHRTLAVGTGAIRLNEKPRPFTSFWPYSSKPQRRIATQL